MANNSLLVYLNYVFLLLLRDNYLSNTLSQSTTKGKHKTFCFWLNSMGVAILPITNKYASWPGNLGHEAYLLISHFL